MEEEKPRAPTPTESQLLKHIASSDKMSDSFGPISQTVATKLVGKGESQDSPSSVSASLYSVLKATKQQETVSSEPQTTAQSATNISNLKDSKPSQEIASMDKPDNILQSNSIQPTAIKSPPQNTSEVKQSPTFSSQVTTGDKTPVATSSNVKTNPVSSTKLPRPPFSRPTTTTPTVSNSVLTKPVVPVQIQKTGIDTDGGSNKVVNANSSTLNTSTTTLASTTSTHPQTQTTTTLIKKDEAIKTPDVNQQPHHNPTPLPSPTLQQQSSQQAFISSLEAKLASSSAEYRPILSSTREQQQQRKPNLILSGDTIVSPSPTKSEKRVNIGNTHTSESLTRSLTGVGIETFPSISDHVEKSKGVEEADFTQSQKSSDNTGPNTDFVEITDKKNTEEFTLDTSSVNNPVGETFAVISPSRTTLEGNVLLQQGNVSLPGIVTYTHMPDFPVYSSTLPPTVQKSYAPFFNVNLHETTAAIKTLEGIDKDKSTTPNTLQTDSSSSSKIPNVSENQNKRQATTTTTTFYFPSAEDAILSKPISSGPETLSAQTILPNKSNLQSSLFGKNNETQQVSSSNVDDDDDDILGIKTSEWWNELMVYIDMELDKTNNIEEKINKHIEETQSYVSLLAEISKCNDDYEIILLKRANYEEKSTDYTEKEKRSFHEILSLLDARARHLLEMRKQQKAQLYDHYFKSYDNHYGGLKRARDCFNLFCRRRREFIAFKQLRNDELLKQLYLIHKEETIQQIQYLYTFVEVSMEANPQDVFPRIIHDVLVEISEWEDDSLIDNDTTKVFYQPETHQSSSSSYATQ